MSPEFYGQTTGAWLKAWQLFAASPLSAADRMTCDMVVYSSEHAESPSDVAWVTRLLVVLLLRIRQKMARRGWP
eukprot:s2232_g12.t1